MAGKLALDAIPPATLAALRFGVALAIFWPLSRWHGESRLTGPPAIGPEQAAVVLYLGAGCSALTYGLWGNALRHLEAGRAATFDTLIPVVGLIAAILVLREAPLVWHVLGGTLVVAGVWMAVSEPRHAVEAAPSLTARPRFSGIRGDVTPRALRPAVLGRR